LDVATVEETEGAEETGEAESARGAGELIDVGDAVEAGDIGGAVVALGVIGAAAGATNSNIATALPAEIFEVSQSVSLP